MIIQFDNAHHVKATEQVKAPLIAMLSQKLSRFSEHIRQLDVHLSDENAEKQGPNDKKCLLQAHMEGLQPLVVKNHGNSYELATEGAIDKLKASLQSALGRRSDHSMI